MLYSTKSIFTCRLACALVLLTSFLGTVFGTDLAGFTEPFRTLKIAADETGTISEILVHEGDRVSVGQPLARLNSEVHEAALAIALQNLKGEGRIRSAKADLQMRQSRLDKLRAIHGEGFARQEEVDRALSEVEIAEANLHAAQEDSILKRLEHEKLAVQLSRRTIVSPVDGTVTIAHKEQGEYVAPNTPEIISIAQLDTLLANFTLTGSQAAKFRKGDEIPVMFSDGDVTQGKIDYISPTMDAESDTILVKVRIENPNGAYRSGQRCRIRLQD